MADAPEQRSFIGAEVAGALIRVTPRRLQQLVTEGWIKREAAGRYTVRGVVHGYLDFKEDEIKRASKTQAEGRLKDVRTREIALRMARDEGELVPIEEARAFVQAVVGATVSRLTGLPAQITRDLDERRRIEAIVDQIRSEVAGLITELAAHYRAGPPPDDAEPEDEPE